MRVSNEVVSRLVRMHFTAGAHRGNEKRFIVTADEKLTAFLELESQLLQGKRNVAAFATNHVAD